MKKSYKYLSVAVISATLGAGTAAFFKDVLIPEAGASLGDKLRQQAQQQQQQLATVENRSAELVALLNEVREAMDYTSKISAFADLKGATFTQMRKKAQKMKAGLDAFTDIKAHGAMGGRVNDLLDDGSNLATISGQLKGELDTLNTTRGVAAQGQRWIASLNRFLQVKSTAEEIAAFDGTNQVAVETAIKKAISLLQFKGLDMGLLENLDDSFKKSDKQAKELIKALHDALLGVIAAKDDITQMTLRQHLHNDQVTAVAIANNADTAVQNKLKADANVGAKKANPTKSDIVS